MPNVGCKAKNHTMKKIYYYFLFIVLISCNSKKDNYLISNDSAGFLKIGMDINKAKANFNDCKIETVDLYKYGLDGGGTGFLVRKTNENLFIFWTNDDQNKINGIICFSSTYHTKQGIKPKMTVGELQKIIPNATIQLNLIDTDYEYILLENDNLCLTFLSTESNRIGKYKNIEREESTTEMRLTAKINYILIKGK